MAPIWAWRAAVTTDQAKTELIAAMTQRGYMTAPNDEGVHASIYPDGDGGALVLSWASGGAAIAAGLSRALSIEGRFAEIELQDREVLASSRSISVEGSLADDTDRSAEATELCEEWFEGRKFRSEAADDLAAIFVNLDECPAEGRIDLLFVRAAGSGRVQALLDAVAAGATWERTALGGRPAIRLKDAVGTRLSVLDETELAAFEREVKHLDPGAARSM